MAKSYFQWLVDFRESFHDTSNADCNAQYNKHMGYTKLLILLAMFLGIMGRFIGDPAELKALYVATTANGVPIEVEDLTAEKDPTEVHDFATKVMRMTFNLDSYSNYKQYRNQLNYVNSRFYRLSWGTLNISEQEYNSGYINDGESKYYLVGQELVAVVIRAGIYRMLTERERKFWLDISGVQIVSSDVCWPPECYTPARYWNVRLQGRLNMVNIDERNARPRYVPIDITTRVGAVSVMQSPDDGMMVERLAAVLGNK